MLTSANRDEPLGGAPMEDDARVPPMPSRRAADRAQVADIMTAPVVCVEPHQDGRELCAVFIEREISGAPVVDRSGRPLGMVSKTDLIRWSCNADPSVRYSVSEIMVSIPVCVKETETIGRAAAVMAFERVHRVPVVDSKGHVVGIVSSIDVMGWLAREHGYVVDDRSSARKT